MKKSDDEPGREEFLAMLLWCKDHEACEGGAFHSDEEHGADARRYQNSTRCAQLCRKYLTRVETPTNGGMLA